MNDIRQVLRENKVTRGKLILIIFSLIGMTIGLIAFLTLIAIAFGS